MDSAEAMYSMADLKQITFARLEKWVSENSQRLIEELEVKLADGEMRTLKEKLKDKKLKKSLCFSFSDIRKIDSNKKLQSFFSQGAKFPDLAVNLFFEKDRDQGGNAQRPDGEDGGSLEDASMEPGSAGVAVQSNDIAVEAAPSSAGVAVQSNDIAVEAAPSSAGVAGQSNGTQSQTGKMNEQYRLLCEWVKKKCTAEGEANEIFGRISVENQVEHSEYPCFIAEKVMVYTDPHTGDKQIIFPDIKNEAAKKNVPKEKKTLLNYQMWVCGIQKAVMINQEERVISSDPTFYHSTITLCGRLVFEVFAPTLAVFKKMQREKLDSLTGNL